MLAWSWRVFLYLERCSFHVHWIEVIALENILTLSVQSRSLLGWWVVMKRWLLWLNTWRNAPYLLTWNYACSSLILLAARWQGWNLVLRAHRLMSHHLIIAMLNKLLLMLIWHALSWLYVLEITHRIFKLCRHRRQIDVWFIIGRESVLLRNLLCELPSLRLKIIGLSLIVHEVWLILQGLVMIKMLLLLLLWIFLLWLVDHDYIFLLLLILHLLHLLLAHLLFHWLRMKVDLTMRLLRLR